MNKTHLFDNIKFFLEVITFLILINSQPYFKASMRLYRAKARPYLASIAHFINKYKTAINFITQSIGLLGFGLCSVMSALVFLQGGSKPAIISCIVLGLCLKLMYGAMKIKEDIVIKY